MWAYVIRRLLYAVPTLLGVLLITFIIFFTLNPPEKQALQQIGSKGATDLDLKQWLADKGAAELTERGEWKIQRRKELADEATRSGRSAIEVNTQIFNEVKEIVLKEIQQEGLTGIDKLERLYHEGLAALTPEGTKKRDLGRLVELGRPLDGTPLDKKSDDEIEAYLKWKESDFSYTGEIYPRYQALSELDYQIYSYPILFIDYVTDLLVFDFGDTNQKRPVTEVLATGFWPSVKLMVPAFFLAEILALFFAMFAALYRGTKIDQTLVVGAVLLMSISPVAMIMFFQKFFAADWQYFPISGYSEGLLAYQYLVLPIFIFVATSVGTRVRFNRILILDEIGQDYVRTARAKGVAQNPILFKHVLRNVLIPLITRWAVIIPNLYLGSLLLESFFGIPGLGDMTYKAITDFDLNTIRALVYIGTIIYILATLLSDVLYAVVDPRVQLK